MIIERRNSGIPPRPQQFSLRTMLTVTTLLAVALGLVVWLAR